MPEEQTRSNGSTWSWFTWMTTVMEGFSKGDGAHGGVDHLTMGIMEEDEHEVPNTQAFTPTLSNDEEVKDMALPETFVNTLEEGTNTSPLTPKGASCKLPRVFGKVTSHKRILIGNANYLVESMNKFVEGSINVERHKLESRERITILFIEPNEKLAIKQMEFEFESRKLELESYAQA